MEQSVCRECGATKTAKPSEYWTPKLGDDVYMNAPDCGYEGKVVGFVPEGGLRAGQPIIERQEDDERPLGPFGGTGKKGDRVVIHPMFLLPFRYGGDEWKKAQAEGRVG